MGSLTQNLRYALRQLLKSPGFTLTAVLTLALGIGATTAIYTVVYATFIADMPYPQPKQLVMVWSWIQGGRNGRARKVCKQAFDHEISNAWQIAGEDLGIA